VSIVLAWSNLCQAESGKKKRKRKGVKKPRQNRKGRAIGRHTNEAMRDDEQLQISEMARSNPTDLEVTRLLDKYNKNHPNHQIVFGPDGGCVPVNFQVFIPVDEHLRGPTLLLTMSQTPWNI
jgi:hypothetical protein